MIRAPYFGECLTWGLDAASMMVSCDECRRMLDILTPKDQERYPGIYEDGVVCFECAGKSQVPKSKFWRDRLHDHDDKEAV